MNIFKKAWNWVFRIEEGEPIYVLAKYTGKVTILPAQIFPKTTEGYRIKYIGVDQEPRTFYAKSSDVVATQNDRPVFDHESGYPYANRPKCINQEGTEEKEQDFGISDAELDTLIGADMITRAIMNLDEILEEGGGWSWKKILIWGGIIALVWYLWQSGWLQSVIGDFLPKAACMLIVRPVSPITMKGVDVEKEQ